MKVLFGLGAVVLAVAIWVWMTFLPETHSWRQKLTLVVETPEGEVRGSSVVAVKVRFFDPPEFMTGNEVHYDLTGEAAMVEVLPGRYLFALIGDSEELFYAAWRVKFPHLTRAEWLQEVSGQKEPIFLQPNQIPLLVTFDDISAPETVRKVDPDDLEGVFGYGVRLKAAMLQLTRDPVTAGPIEAVLPWLDGPRYMNNPGWAALPVIAKDAILGLRTPIAGQ